MVHPGITVVSCLDPHGSLPVMAKRVCSYTENGEDGRYNALCSTEKSNGSRMTRYVLNLLRAKSNFKVTFPEINGSAEV